MLPRALAAFLASVVFGAPAVAQVSHIAGTGCGAAITYVGGQPNIGQPISIANSSACFTGTALLALGLQPTAQAWPGCATPVCTIGVVPIDLAIGGGMFWRTLWLPNDPALRGVTLLAQTGCLSLVTGCAQLDQVARIVIQ